jgi:hypothetical protein
MAAGLENFAAQNEEFYLKNISQIVDDYKIVSIHLKISCIMCRNKAVSFQGGSGQKTDFFCCLNPHLR